MHRETFDEALLGFKRRTPYQPFKIVTVSGDRYEIDHPEAILVRDGVALFKGPSGVIAIFDHEGVSQVVGDLAANTIE